MTPYRKILVAIDFSEQSDVAVERAHEFAAKTGATITLLHAWQMPLFAGPEILVYGPGETRASLQDYLSRAARTRLEALRASLAARGFGEEIRTELREGDPATVILELAKDADLLVMGTHGRGALARFAMGSVAERVIRMAPCPVMTLKRAA